MFDNKQFTVRIKNMKYIPRTLQTYTLCTEISTGKQNKSGLQTKNINFVTKLNKMFGFLWIRDMDI